jgi:hypothetical protein
VKRAPQTSAPPVLSSLQDFDARSDDNQPSCVIVARNFHIHGRRYIVKVRQ